MWIFTNHGFFKAVCARWGDGERGQTVDPNRGRIRARARPHLEALKNRFPDRLARWRVQEVAGTDHAFRVRVA